MNLTALALLALAAGPAQPPASDVMPTKSRTLKLDIDYKPDQRKNIQQVQLCVSQDQGQSYQVMDAVTADKDHLIFRAPEDGLYWVNMVIVFKDGKRDPFDVSRVAPAMKLMVDATPPVVRVTNAQRVGDEVTVEWVVDEKFPNDAATQVTYKPIGPTAVGDWQPVPAGSVVKRTARFKPAASGPIAVQVVAHDLAGNTGSAVREMPTGVTAGYLAPGAKNPDQPAAGADSPLPAPSLGGLGAGPTAPSAPPVVPAADPMGPAANQTNSVVPTAPAPATPLPVTPSASAPKPIDVWTGAQQPQPTYQEPPSSVQFIRFPRFDLQYQVETGPSGVLRIDLYVTRDDGRTWTKWSSHDGKESPLRVRLDTPFNTQREGDYGFRLVPVSGAGLTDDAPTPGTPPEFRVQLDETPPLIRPYQPTTDPNQRGTLVLHWQASDRNFGKDPIAIDWSENPTGPWKPVTGGDGLTPVGGVQSGNRVPNTGQYAWQLPASMTTHKVYLKFTAWDAAGNKSEVVTQSPVTVDLVRPRAKILSISTGTTITPP